MVDFKIAWTEFYPGCHPVGYMMRAAGAQHWLRFHSLPRSKRYVDSDIERQALLARQNLLAGEVLGHDDPCWLAQTCWEAPEGSIDASAATDPFWVCRDRALSFSFRFLTDESEDEESAWNVYAASTRWQNGTFDGILLSIADERAAPTLWMSRSGAVFAPYDGGIDLFLPTLSLAKELATRYASWLSPHPHGL